jgi:hypothetical protein
VDQNHASRAAPSLFNVLIGISGIIGLLAPLGLNLTREEKELLGFILGGIAVIVGLVGLVPSIRDSRDPLKSGYPFSARIKSVIVALVVFLVGVALVLLGLQAAVSSSHAK